MTSSFQSAKRKGMRTFITATAILMLLQTAVAPLSGVAAAASSSTEPKVTTASSTTIYKTFQSMLYKKNGLPAADIYLESHINQVTTYHATLMVLQLENARNKALTAMTDRLLVPNVQDKMIKAYKWNDSFTQLMSRTNDASLRALLQQARDSGYRLVMLEGSLYPIMNYMAFQKYISYVKPDIKQYINIMAVETSNLAADDGALVIGYQEVLNRAMNQERFLNEYPKSNRVQQVENLMNNYTLYTFYGLNNTPLFDYETNKMTANAQKGYKAVLQRNSSEDSAFLTKLEKFMDIVTEAKFEKTATVEKWLEQNVPVSDYANY
ncbi:MULTISPECIES: hypothetical protein [unclassified Paenibacillus]|uniref:hypothetical protein n=1 Tax=unclassified Paenibacillus TaxID=185978 RepID=UPI000CFBE754|nr:MULTISPECIES: hypothetical protein [unclassified Paenibacillus]PQZ99004.1 hypothetical protein CQ043_28055 [Paenibacillus sp. MYb63]PRA43995.1 hypothetical protein CQ061_27580 [Paenibacillus sp. MYb67]QZN77825.1 hypothetical protein K5K90_11905 [Paenibacillus sp. DR312]